MRREMLQMLHPKFWEPTGVCVISGGPLTPNPLTSADHRSEAEAKLENVADVASRA
jgi:hypothetical protein